MANRNTLRDELGKGMETLRTATTGPLKSATGALTQYGIIGPFAVDVDVKSVHVNSHTPVSAGTNTLDVFNGPEASAAPIITQFDPDTVVADTPLSVAVDAANRRVPAGTPIVVKLVVAAADPTEDVSVTIGYDPVIGKTTYGAYDKDTNSGGGYV